MRPVSVLCRSVEKELTHVEVDSPQPRSDEDLVTEYNAGRADALDVLIDRYYERVLGQAYHRMKEVDVAREVAQGVFVRVVRALPWFRGDSAFSTWLHRITVNVCLDYLRSAYRKPAVDLVDTAPEHGVRWHLNALNCSPYEYVAASELAGSIERAATQLPTVQQRVFRMRYYDHMPLGTIARELDRSVGTVKANLFYARSALKESLAEYTYGSG